MKVIVKLFASHRELAGESEIALDLAGNGPPGVSDVIDELFKRFPEMKKLKDETIISVNKNYAELDQKLNDGDEVAVFPPVSGG